MKKHNHFVILAFFSFLVANAQSPNLFNYQAVVRNASGFLVANTVVGVKVSILQGSVAGTVVYAETQSPLTNFNGLLTILIGNGSVITGNINTINWANGPYFIKSEIDPFGATNYTIATTSQLLSVPYALYAEKAGAVEWGSVQNKPIIPTSFSGSYLDLTNKPIIPTSFSGSYLTLTNKPTFAVVATTGSYNDLTNKPVINTFTGGNGISITGTNQIVNTAIDKNISIAGVNVTVTGTYPLFTLTGQANSVPNGTIAGQMLYWNGNMWQTVASGAQNQILTYCNGVPTWITQGALCPVKIGEAYQGGVVGYILQPGDFGYDPNMQHGLIAATNDQSAGTIWGSAGANVGTSAAIGSGNNNTNATIALHGEGNYAAKICADLSLNGYTDWYLPSINELIQICNNGYLIGGFVNLAYYWSSSELNPWTGSLYIIGYGPGYNTKYSSGRVRAIRSF